MHTLRNHARMLLVLLALAGMAMFGSCTKKPTLSLKPGEGFVDVPGGKVWYRVVGQGQGTPLLVLHGGPGLSSYYLKPLAALGDERPVIFYDQLGSGHSSQTNDTTLWTIDHFLQELAKVREALGLKEVYLYGHSWGAILATDYLLTKPGGAKAVILASPPLSVARWMKDADSLLSTMPDSIRQVIRQTDSTKAYDSPAYQAAVGAYYQQFLARKQPWSPDMDSTLAQINQELYVYMNGPSEFNISGTLRNYERLDRLHEITVPVLFTVGEYDEVTPSTARLYQDSVPSSELAVIPNAGHLAMQDDSAAYVQVLRDFLHRMDAKQ